MREDASSKKKGRPKRTTENGAIGEFDGSSKSGAAIGFSAGRGGKTIGNGVKKTRGHSVNVTATSTQTDEADNSTSSSHGEEEEERARNITKEIPLRLDFQWSPIKYDLLFLVDPETNNETLVDDERPFR